MEFKFHLFQQFWLPRGSNYHSHYRIQKILDTVFRQLIVVFDVKLQVKIVRMVVESGFKAITLAHLVEFHIIFPITTF